MEELVHPRTLFALGMNGEPLTPEHGAPLRLVIPFKYGYKSSKLITKITLIDHGGQGVVADTWPYYSATGDIERGVDHPFDLPGVAKKINGGGVLDYLSGLPGLLPSKKCFLRSQDLWRGGKGRPRRGGGVFIQLGRCFREGRM